MDSHIRFLEPFVIDPLVLERDPGVSATDLTKKVHHIFSIMREDPVLLKPADVWRVVNDKDCQTKFREIRMGHFQRVARINKDLVQKLTDQHPELDLPNPNHAYSLGLVHDIVNTYVKWDGFYVQEEKELPLYFHAKHFLIPSLADAAMHNAYFGILKMIYKGEGFSTVQRYAEWTAALNDAENPNNYENIINDFSSFLGGKDKLGLITLTIADCVDDFGNTGTIDFMDLKPHFDKRMNEILHRTYHTRISGGLPPKAMGIDLHEMGGMERLKSYVSLVDDLLKGRSDQHREERPLLWR